MLSRLATWRICGDKIPRVTPQPWKYEILSSVNLGRKKFELRMLICSAHLGCTHECGWVYTQTKKDIGKPRVTNGSDNSADLSFRDACLGKPRSINKIFFNPSIFDSRWKGDNGKGMKGGQGMKEVIQRHTKQQQGKSTLLHWWTPIDSEVYVHSLGEFERTIIILHVLYITKEFLLLRILARSKNSQSSSWAVVEASLPKSSWETSTKREYNRRFWPIKIARKTSKLSPSTSTIIEYSGLFPDEFW